MQSILSRLISLPIKNPFLSSAECRLHLSIFLTRNISLTTISRSSLTKWSNADKIKLSQDVARQKESNTLILKMKSCLRKNKSIDPEKNTVLAELCEKASQLGLPKPAISELIAAASSKVLDESAYLVDSSATGALYIVKTLTYDHNRRRDLNKSISKVCSKNNCKRSIINLMNLNHFASNSIVSICSKGISEDAAFDIGIAADTEEVELDEKNEMWLFVSSGPDVEILQSKVGKVAEVVHAEVVFEPYLPIELTDKKLEEADQIYETLYSIPDVINVFRNY